MVPTCVVVLYRLCWALQLTPDLPALAQLMCPALSSAVQLHTAGLAEAAPADMAAWKAQRHARPLTTQSSMRCGCGCGACAEHVGGHYSLHI
jgi:hypothetical protein